MREGRGLREKRGMYEGEVGGGGGEEMAAHHSVFDLEKEIHYLHLLLVPHPEPNVLYIQTNNFTIIYETLFYYNNNIVIIIIIIYKIIIEIILFYA